MSKDLGLIEVPNGNEFGNTWSVKLTPNEGNEEFHSGVRPVQFYGCHALVQRGEEYLLLDEDDGSFWTAASLTRDEVLELKNVVDKLKSQFRPIGRGVRLKIINKRTFVYDRKHSIFPSTVVDRKDIRPLIRITVKNAVLCFDAGWLETLSQVLDI